MCSRKNKLIETAEYIRLVDRSDWLDAMFFAFTSPLRFVNIFLMNEICEIH